MTNIGQTLCLVCGQISCEQVFYYSTLNVAITIAKNWRNQYAVFASTSDGKTLFVQLHEKPTIDKDTGTILKLKLELAVRGNSTPHSVTLHARNRICPHCLRKGHITQLSPLAGQAPTFYIGLLGLPSVGKSVLLNAAFTGKVVSILNQALHGCKLETGVSQESLQIDATQLSADAMGLLKTVRVVATNGKLVAVLHFKDSPGELFDPEKYGSKAFENHFETFGQCDALLYVADHHQVQAEGLPQGTLPWDPDRFLQELPRNLPTAVVLTKTDQLVEYLPLRNSSGDVLLNRASPIFRTIREQEIPQQMLLARHLLLQMLPSVAVSSLSSNELAGYFFVSSGRERKDKTFDYNVGYNQHLPFLFLLNALGLGSFLREEGV